MIELLITISLEEEEMMTRNKLISRKSRNFVMFDGDNTDIKLNLIFKFNDRKPMKKISCSRIF